MRYLLFCLAMLTSGCQFLHTSPVRPPTPTATAQEISRAQSIGLPKLGTITAQKRGSPDDVQRAIKRKANRLGAAYYQIIMLDENIVPGLWYASAVLYGPSSAGHISSATADSSAP